MSPSRWLLDTSALLTFIEGEAGADRVEALLGSGDALLHWMCLLETYYVTYRERGAAEANERYALVRQLPVAWVEELDEITLLTAGRFKASHRISLADAVIAAAAFRLEATLVHKDPELDALAGEIATEALPYKRG